MNVLKELGIFVAGAALGVAATHVYFKQKYQAEAKEQISQMKHFHEREIEKLKGKEQRKFSTLEQDAKAKKEYSTISQSYATIDRLQEVEEKLEIMSKIEHPEEDRPTEPYAISNDEFVYEEEDYEKLPLSFYIADESLVDENEELADIDQTIGKECYQVICVQKPDTFWVRNPKISCDFEIFAIDGSYKEEILGEE